MSPDDIDATKLHELFKHTKARELKLGRVKTNFIGKWECRTSGRLYRVYEKEYIDLGCFEYWMKRSGKVERIHYDFDRLIKTHKRVDNLRR